MQPDVRTTHRPPTAPQLRAGSTSPPHRTPRLRRPAPTIAEWMQSTDTVGHTGANGSSVADRVAAAGYAWQSVGENVAAGQAELATVIAGWLDSPGHCSNIMNAAFVDAALAMKPGTSANRFRSYWTLVLARPR